MSNRKSASQLRREWWMLCIREQLHGRRINVAGQMYMDDDLRRLIASGVVTLHRVKAGSGRQTMVKAADGQPNPPGVIICPDCKRGSDASYAVEHKVGCAIGHQHPGSVRYRDAVESFFKKAPKILSASHRD